jgi:hypothetical protein
MRRQLAVRLLSLFVLSAALSLAVTGQQLQLDNGSAKRGGDANLARYQYVFVNERFTVPRIEVAFDGTGAGQYSFKRKDSDEIINKLTVSEAVLGQIRALLFELNFLDSHEDYQHKKDFSHLGTMTITYARGGRERTTQFNYTDNQTLNRLAEIFRNLATQEMRVFELENTRQTDPISMPVQMRLLESELRGKHLADPPKLIPLLKDLKQDESIPLIARNHAERLIQMIQKGK